MRPSTLLFLSFASLGLVACGGQAFEDKTSSPPGTSAPGSSGSTQDPSGPGAEPARTKAAFCATAERTSMDIEMFRLLTPTPSADYLALRRLSGGFDEPPGGRQVITDAERGVKCASAVDRAKCERRYESIPFDSLFYSYVFFTRGDEVGMVESAADAMKLIGVVDSPEDAFFVARYAGFAATCAGEASAEFREVDGAYELVTQQGGCMSPVERVVVRVKRDGTTEVVSKTKIGEPQGCM